MRASGTLYLSYGSDRAAGWLLAYDLRKDIVLWQANYPSGVDSMSISPDGKTIYMPTGELSSGGIWEVLDAKTGSVIGSIDSKGVGPHNTVVSADGSHVYMGPRFSDYAAAANTANRAVTDQICPVKSGVRPFVINRGETLAFLIQPIFLAFRWGISIRAGSSLQCRCWAFQAPADRSRATGFPCHPMKRKSI